jgi:hypothetical protein
MDIKIDKKRRNFLKFLFYGGGAFLLGGILSKIGFDRPKESILNNFVVKESRREIVFYNRQRHRLFTLKHNGDLEIG